MYGTKGSKGISKKKITIKIPVTLLGIIFRIQYKGKKYHSGTMCLGVFEAVASI
jgi:hypothetical protein